MPEPKKQTPETLFANPALQTLFSDRIMITRRNDDMVLFRFMSQVPEMHIEQARLVMTAEHARQVIDILTRLMEHYPQKPPAADKK